MTAAFRSPVPTRRGSVALLSDIDLDDTISIISKGNGDGDLLSASGS